MPGIRTPLVSCATLPRAASCLSLVWALQAAVPCSPLHARLPAKGFSVTAHTAPVTRLPRGALIGAVPGSLPSPAGKG